jgi:hypothetical protein
MAAPSGNRTRCDKRFPTIFRPVSMILVEITLDFFRGPCLSSQAWKVTTGDECAMFPQT